MGRGDFPPGLRSVKQRLTPPKAVSIPRMSFERHLTNLTGNRVCVGSNSRPIEYVALSFHALVHGARNAFARIFL